MKTHVILIIFLYSVSAFAADVKEEVDEARALLNSDKYDLAIELLNHAIDSGQLDPANEAIAYLNRATAKNLLGQTESAFEDAGSGLRLIEKHYPTQYRSAPIHDVWGKLRFNLGYTLHGLKRYSEAIQAYSLGLMEDGISVAVRKSLLLGRATSLGSLGDFSGSLKDSDEVIEIDAYAKGGFVFRAYYLGVMGEFERSETAMYDGLRHTYDAKDRAIWMNEIAWIKATCKVDAIRDGKAALEMAQLALEVLPAGSELRTNMLDTLSAAYAELGDFDQALSINSALLANLENSKSSADALKELRLSQEQFKQRKPYRDSCVSKPPTF
jgi:tetratricopeptide (TPR) repeat protein